MSDVEAERMTQEERGKSISHDVQQNSGQSGLTSTAAVEATLPALPTPSPPQKSPTTLPATAKAADAISALPDISIKLATRGVRRSTRPKKVSRQL